MTLPSPRYAVQSAVFAALDALFGSSVRVSDAPDADTPLPFIDIGKSDLIAGDDKTAVDFELNMSVVIVSDMTSGQGTAFNSGLQEQVRARLVDQPLTLTAGYGLNWVICASLGEVTRSEDGQYFISQTEFTFYFQKT